MICKFYDWLNLKMFSKFIGIIRMSNQINFFMMLFADSVCEVRHHTATVGNLWENVVFLFSLGVRAWHYGNSDEKAG